MNLTTKGQEVVSAYEKIIKAYKEAEKAMLSVEADVDFVWKEVHDDCDACALWDVGPEELVERLQEGICGLEQELGELKDPDYYPEYHEE